MAVSKVLHGKGSNVRVSTETAATISRVAASLNYRPNGLARRFRSQRTHTIGLVFDNAPQSRHHGRYFYDIIEGATQAAFANEYSITLCPQLIGTRAIDACSDGRFDGILWARTRGDAKLDAWVAEGMINAVILHVPIYAETDGEPRVAAPTVTWNNAEACQLIIDHLRELGHQQVIAVSCVPDHDNIEYLERLEHLNEAAAARGMRPVEWKQWSFDAEELGPWWHHHRTASAVVALNEEAALAILAAAQRDQISIPDQLSLITYDSTLTCDATRPRLSAVFQPLADMAASATKMLIHAASAQPSSLEELPATIHYFPARLDLRESTARPYPITQN